MKTVKLLLDDEDYRALVGKRRRAGLPSVQALLLKGVGLRSSATDAKEIVRKALLKARRREGGPFRLRDLFGKTEWEAFDKSARLHAGKLFAEEVAKPGSGLTAAGRSSSNHQYYVRAGK